MNTFLTVDDLAVRWHTTPHAVRNMRSKGQLPAATRIGRRLLWDAADVEAFEAERREQPKTSAGERFSKPRSWPAKKDYSDWGKTG